MPLKRKYPDRLPVRVVLAQQSLPLQLLPHEVRGGPGAARDWHYDVGDPPPH
ncbi:MAG TPA: hypothetical protein VJ835_08810 [Fimbriimonadaceae bacterium]|nr:hypothetical protein [Fimbriimonadaceae bacterium]